MFKTDVRLMFSDYLYHVTDDSSKHLSNLIQINLHAFIFFSVYISIVIIQFLKYTLALCLIVGFLVVCLGCYFFFSNNS